MYPKVLPRCASSDSIFGVAMTLLVLDVRLPESFQPRDASELVHALFELWPKFLPYLLSFLVLGLRWLSEYPHPFGQRNRRPFPCPNGGYFTIC